MPLSVFACVLGAAALHALWNMLVKRGQDPVLSMVMVTGGAAALAFPVVLLLPLPRPESWPYLAGSALLQVTYFSVLAQTYRVADMGLVYPIMRGTAPLLVVIGGLILTSDHGIRDDLPGILVISLGVLMMAFGRHRGSANRLGIALALLTSGIIAGYTVVDGLGVRLAGNAASYTLWLSLLTGCPLVVWALFARWRAFPAYVVTNWSVAVIGGAGTMVSYGLALWAMTLAPVAMVAALRETSIVFAVLLSVLVLKERVDPVRMIAAVIIACGAALSRLG